MPTRLIFWNTYRLGSSSPKEKRMYTEGVLAQAFEEGADIALLCEVTSGLTLGDSQIDKQLMVAKKTNKKTSSQLGYAAIKKNLETINISSIQPRNYKIVSQTGRYLKGGSSFKGQSKRKVAYIGQIGTLKIYMYHSNASTKAAAMTSWVAHACYEDSKGSFLLVGDFNCEPSNLIKALKFNASDNTAANNDKKIFTALQNMVYYDTTNKTHNAKHVTMTKVYDYAICSTNCDITALKDLRDVIPTKSLSDHLPIFIDI